MSPMNTNTSSSRGRERADLSSFSPAHAAPHPPTPPYTPLPPSPASATPSETSAPLTSLLWLAAYFLNALILTIYNKAAMQFLDFTFPWALTGIHNLCSLVGCYALYSSGTFKPARLSRRGNWIMIAFSFLYTINIAMSNVSLNLVTVPFHQIVRATTPVFVLLINTMWLSKFPSHSILVSLIPTILGVGIATYGDYYFTAYGLFLTVLGTFLSALKGVITNLIQVDELKLHPMDLLMRMAPLACVQTLVASWWTGELENMRTWTWEPWKGWVLVGNGILAFSMNLVSFTANKKTSALTMGVAGNVKQVLSIILAVLVFSLHITPLNGLGIILTLFGGAYYTIVDLQLRQPQSRLPKHLRTNPRHEDVKFAESEKDGLMSERGQGVEVLVR